MQKRNQDNQNQNQSSVQNTNIPQRIEIIPSPLKIIPKQKLRNEIQKVLKNEKFWDLCKMNLSTDEIISICKIGENEKKLEGIEFYGNNFNGETEKAYYNFVEKNCSILGIVVVDLNISPNLKIEIIKLMKIKENIKFAVIERKSMQEGMEKILQKEMELELNNYDSKYWMNAYSLNHHLTYHHRKYVWFFSRPS